MKRTGPLTVPPNGVEFFRESNEASLAGAASVTVVPINGIYDILLLQTVSDATLRKYQGICHERGEANGALGVPIERDLIARQDMEHGEREYWNATRCMGPHFLGCHAHCIARVSRRTNRGGQSRGPSFF